MSSFLVTFYWAVICSSAIDLAFLILSYGRCISIFFVFSELIGDDGLYMFASKDLKESLLFNVFG